MERQYPQSSGKIVGIIALVIILGVGVIVTLDIYTYHQGEGGIIEVLNTSEVQEGYDSCIEGGGDQEACYDFHLGGDGYNHCIEGGVDPDYCDEHYGH